MHRRLSDYPRGVGWPVKAQGRTGFAISRGAKDMGRREAGEKMKIDLQFADLLQGARDDEILSDAPTDTEESSDVAHPLDKIIAEATLGTFLGPGDAGRRHAHNIGVEAQERDAQLTAHYK